MLTPDAERREVLQALKCSWLQFGAEVRSAEIALRARRMRIAPTAPRRA
jgi:hypothetical protein